MPGNDSTVQEGAWNPIRLYHHASHTLIYKYSHVIVTHNPMPSSHAGLVCLVIDSLVGRHWGRSLCALLSAWRIGFDSASWHWTWWWCRGGWSSSDSSKATKQTSINTNKMMTVLKQLVVKNPRNVLQTTIRDVHGTLLLHSNARLPSQENCKWSN